MFVHLEQKPSSQGNRIPLQENSLLAVSNKPHIAINISSNTRDEYDNPNSFKDDLIFDEADLENTLDFYSLSLIKKTVNTYMDGFIVRFLSKSLKCFECLFTLKDYPATQNCALIQKKDKGSSIISSLHVVKLINAAKVVFQQCVTTHSGKIITKLRSWKIGGRGAPINHWKWHLQWAVSSNWWPRSRYWYHYWS